MMKNILLPFLFCLAHLLSAGQNPNDKIDLKKVNFDLVEKLFMEKLNHYRQSLALCELGSDHVLQQAAQDHALYLRKLKKLTHHQEASGKKHSPMDRVHYYHGQCEMTAENALSTNIGVPVLNRNTGQVRTIVTYAQAADALFEGWKTSPAHHKAMIGPKYKNAGIGFAYDPGTGVLYAVQVFANRVVKIPFV